MVFPYVLLGCTGMSDRLASDDERAVSTQPTEIRVNGETEYNRMSTEVGVVQRGPHRDKGVVIILASGTYRLSLQLGTPDLPLDITIRGEDDVWFDGARIEVEGRNIAVENVGFRGSTSSGSLVSIDASGGVGVTNLRVHDAQLGQPQPAPSTPRRGKRSRPSHIVNVDTTGTGKVVLSDIAVTDSTIMTDTLISVTARPAREVVLSGLDASGLTDVEPIIVSTGSTIVRK